MARTPFIAGECIFNGDRRERGERRGGGKGRGCSHQYVNAGVITTLPQRKTSRLCLSWENIPSPVNAVLEKGLRPLVLAINVSMHLSLKVILFLALRK